MNVRCLIDAHFHFERITRVGSFSLLSSKILVSIYFFRSRGPSAPGVVGVSFVWFPWRRQGRRRVAPPHSLRAAAGGWGDAYYNPHTPNKGCTNRTRPRRFSISIYIFISLCYAPEFVRICIRHRTWCKCMHSNRVLNVINIYERHNKSYQ